MPEPSAIAWAYIYYNALSSTQLTLKDGTTFTPTMTQFYPFSAVAGYRNYQDQVKLYAGYYLEDIKGLLRTHDYNLAAKPFFEIKELSALTPEEIERVKVFVKDSRFDWEDDNGVTHKLDYDSLSATDKYKYANLMLGEEYILANKDNFIGNSDYFDSQATLPSGSGDLKGVGTSNHGVGNAMDFNTTQNSNEEIWLVENGATYGYSRTTSEHWHFKYTG